MRLFLILCLLFSFNLSAKETIVLNKDNTVVLDLPFDQSSTTSIIKKVQKLSTDPLSSMFPKVQTLKKDNKDIFLVIISPGGDMVAGLDMLDILNSLPVNIHTITLFGASMGFISSQLLGKRYITEHGVMMSHLARGSFGPSEFPGQMDNRYNFWKRRITKINEKIVKRTKNKQTIDTYQKLIDNEYWCEGYDCILDGFADSVVNVFCDQSLNGTFTELVSINFLGNNITLSVIRHNCPLIQGYKLKKASVGGKSYKFDNKFINDYIKNHVKKLNNNLNIGK